MAKFLLVVATLALSLLGVSAAGAQAYTQYPFCALYGLNAPSCAFNTMEQCRASVSGRGGLCEANPDYRPPARPIRRGAAR